MSGRGPCVLALSAAAFGLAACSGGDETAARCVDAVAARASAEGGSTLNGVAREVERLRGLRFRATPKPGYVQRKAFERRLRAELDRYPAAEADVDERVLTALGALPPGTDLKALLRSALPGQVAGYYDPKDGRLVVRSDAQRKLSAIERLTLAHELVHALTDQALDLPSYLEADAPPAGLEDAAAAGIALVEGDAMLITDAYAARHISLADALSGVGSALAGGDEFARLPHFIQASVLFPYEEGPAFVCALFTRGGWRAVDRAYRRPPASTAEILFPERYVARERPVNPPDPPAPPGGRWRRLDRAAVGAADLLWLFEAPGGKPSRALPDARARAASWAGGEAHVWGRGRTTLVKLTLVQRRGGRDLCASVRAWARAARRDGVVRCSRRIVRATLRSERDRRRR